MLGAHGFVQRARALGVAAQRYFRCPEGDRGSFERRAGRVERRGKAQQRRSYPFEPFSYPLARAVERRRRCSHLWEDASDLGDRRPEITRDSGQVGRGVRDGGPDGAHGALHAVLNLLHVGGVVRGQSPEGLHDVGQSPLQARYLRVRLPEHRLANLIVPALGELLHLVHQRAELGRQELKHLVAGLRADRSRERLREILHRHHELIHALLHRLTQPGDVGLKLLPAGLRPRTFGGGARDELLKDLVGLRCGVQMDLLRSEEGPSTIQLFGEGVQVLVTAGLRVAQTEAPEHGEGNAGHRLREGQPCAAEQVLHPVLHSGDPVIA
ncbi:MAG: hypothetical protein IPI35_29920 [Deltaproteobacteria bacterium]|nr:hypothetical protein [Deltaproteobacteria bacterium]